MMENLLTVYIKLLKEKGENGESFKWNAIEHFQKHWDIAADDFYKMFKEAFRFRENLFFQNSWGFINKAAKHFPEPVRKMFKTLYDEDIALEQRIVTFQKESEKLLPDLKKAVKNEKLNHQQDERTISVYLSFHNPEKYFIYMSSFYGNYCRLMNIPEAGKNKKYLHYLKLANDFKNRFIKDNSELKTIQKNIYPVTSWNSDNLTTQNIFYLILKNESDMEKLMNKTSQINIVVVNITWNSNDWKSPSDDSSNHRWVQAGNIPHESWNFDFENPRNNNDTVYGFAQFTHPPLINGNNNLIIFHSKDKIVGFYGKAEILHTPHTIDDEMSYNLIGEKNLSLVLTNKIEKIKDKGYLENKKRMGQVGFVYLKQKETALKIIDEAIELNPEEQFMLAKIKSWITQSDVKPNADLLDLSKPSLNQILFGPPGTGKTYNTINKALEIVHGANYLTDKNREELVGEFNRLKDAGRIEFITFHQSFSYEDFVEGIKPVISQTGEEDEYVKTPNDKKAENGEIQYEIRAGIFKKMCEKAKGVRADSKKQVGSIDFDKASYFKMSVGGKQKPHIHNWCIENNQLALGWGNEKDYSDLEKHVGNWKNFRDIFKKKYPEIAEESAYHITAMYIFMKMKKGDIVLVSKGNKIIDAIGIIKDNKYIFDDTQDFGYYQFRNVEWIATGLNASADLFVTKNISQQSIYMLNEQDINKEYFKKEFSPAEKENAKENYVLIIDEINRGNVASIFGELITLIEEDKRMGTDNELFVRLPYSGSEGDLFGVPSNLHIIGTMNTADRSIEALDTALRRRFSFEEMLPNPELIKAGGLTPDGKIDEIDVVEMLQKMNDRIEKLIDKDHMIGHSFFMNIKKEKAALVKVFQDKIIPLLEEYFYGDFGKIGLVLGQSFVEKVNRNGFEFAVFPEYDELITDLKTRAVYRIAEKENWDFVSIYSKKAKDEKAD